MSSALDLLQGALYIQVENVFVSVDTKCSMSVDFPGFLIIFILKLFLTLRVFILVIDQIDGLGGVGFIEFSE